MSKTCQLTFDHKSPITRLFKVLIPMMGGLFIAAGVTDYAAQRQGVPKDDRLRWAECSVMDHVHLNQVNPVALSEALAPGKLAIIGDTDHRETKLRQFMASDQFLSTARAQGRQYIALELPQSLQQAADKLAANTITTGQFTDLVLDERAHDPLVLAHKMAIPDRSRFETMALIIRQASAFGIKTLMVDDPGKLDQDLANMAIGKKSTVEQAMAFKGALAASRTSLSFNRGYLDRALAGVRQSENNKLNDVEAASKLILFVGLGHEPSLQEEAGYRGVLVTGFSLFKNEFWRYAINRSFSGEDMAPFQVRIQSLPQLTLSNNRWHKALQP